MANTLRLWTMARLTSNIEWICGGDVVGSVVDDQSSPFQNTVPVPPMTCAQVEVISYSSLLHPLRRKILKELKTMLLSNPRNSWLTIYLTLFILLHSCSHTSRRDEAFGRDIGHSVSQSKKNMHERGIDSSQLRFTNAASIADHHVGVLTLLTYFHYACKEELLSAMLEDPRGERDFAATSDIPPEYLHFIKWSGMVINEKGIEMSPIRSSKVLGL